MQDHECTHRPRRDGAFKDPQMGEWGDSIGNAVVPSASVVDEVATDESLLSFGRGESGILFESVFFSRVGWGPFSAASPRLSISGY